MVLPENLVDSILQIKYFFFQKQQLLPRVVSVFLLANIQSMRTTNIWCVDPSAPRQWHVAKKQPIGSDFPLADYSHV